MLFKTGRVVKEYTGGWLTVFKVQVTTSWWRHHNKIHSCYSGTNFPWKRISRIRAVRRRRHAAAAAIFVTPPPPVITDRRAAAPPPTVCRRRAGAYCRCIHIPQHAFCFYWLIEIRECNKMPKCFIALETRRSRGSESEVRRSEYELALHCAASLAVRGLS